MKQLTPELAALAAQLSPDWSGPLILQLHPVFAAGVLRAALDARRYTTMRVVPHSAWRGNAEQKALRDAYEKALADYKAGKTKVPPLPAACPGHSAHNWTVCTEDATHDFGEGSKCSVCGAEGEAAAVGLDVAILDALGNHIRTGGAIPETAQPREWQLWFQVIALHADLRDGGKAYNDPVHVESAYWNDKDFKFEPPTAPAPVKAKAAAKKPLPPAPETEP